MAKRTPKPPGLVIRKTEGPVQFDATPKSFKGTGTFASNGFKADDRGASR